MNIAQVLAAQAAASPDRDAIIDGQGVAYRRTTYLSLERKAADAAAAFVAAGLGRGDTVLFFHPMSMELYAALIGAFRAGLSAMFIDPSAGRAQIGQCCDLHPPQAFLGTAKAHLLRLMVPRLRRVPHKFVTAGWVPGAANLWRSEVTGPPPLVPCAPDDPALITFTSGSTGQPKGIVRTHGFLIAQHRVLERSLEYGAGEVDLTTLPVFLLANLASGLTSVIPDADLRYPGRIDALRVMRQVDALAPQRTAASPAFVERLVEHCETRGRTLGSLSEVFVGGAPVYPQLITRAQAKIATGRLVAVYGSTEAEPIAHVEAREISGADLEAMAGGCGLLAGHPVEEIELAIVRNSWGEPIAAQTAESFAAMSLPAGETGEIVVSGDHVVGGYLHGVGDAETKFEVDARRWHRTGDLGYLDALGRLWLMGRAAATLTDASGTLYPFAVECAAMRGGAVARAALLLHEGRRTLTVQPSDTRSGLDAAALGSALEWAKLDEIVECPRIPLDARHNAKVDYPALRAWLQRTQRRRAL